MFTVVIERSGGGPLELTPRTDSVRFSSSAVGGFGSASFRVPPALLGSIPLLSTVRLRHGTRLLWEGRIEDKRLSVTGEDAFCDVTCFGFRRILEETGIVRIWIMRGLNWAPGQGASGLVACGGGPSQQTAMFQVDVGQFDSSDLSRVGVRVRQVADNTVAGQSNWAILSALTGITFIKTYCTVASAGGGMLALAQDFNGTSWTSLFCASTGSVDTSFTHTSPGATKLLLGGVRNTISTWGPSVVWEGIRVLCTSLDEDEPGGMYGGAIIEDVLALIAGLGAGRIESGSDFAIPNVGRGVRDTTLSVIEEVAAYYNREWAIWEDGLLDWKSPGLDEPHWVIPVNLCATLEVESSLENLTERVFLLYEDAASGQPAESSSTSTDQRNPFVKSERVKDQVFQAPVVMTGASGAQLAAKLAGDRGAVPAVRGRVVIPSERGVASATGHGSQPAFTIRGGENIVIPELPKDDYLRPGRDGQTIFHVRSAETDMETGLTTLELEGYSLRSDALIARVSAVTRAITG